MMNAIFASATNLSGDSRLLPEYSTFVISRNGNDWAERYPLVAAAIGLLAGSRQKLRHSIVCASSSPTACVFPYAASRRQVRSNRCKLSSISGSSMA
jgi:hypothetical protein